MNDIVKILLGLVLIIGLLIVGPWLVIWALNVLFPVLAIQFGLSAWFAVIILGAFLRANVTVKRKD